MWGLMAKLIYSFQASLDGFINKPDGGFAELTPDEEVHRFHNEQAREIGVQIYGRRLYETMRVWETLGDDPAANEVTREFAAVWKETRKLVFSRTLDSVDDAFTLVPGDLAEEVGRLKAEDRGDIGVGGAELAASLIELGLVDEYRLVTYPVVFGGGTPFFPELAEPLALELVESRVFGSGAVFARYVAR